MRDAAAKIAAAIADAEKGLGLDWRTSWSKVAMDPGGTLRVSVSRREVQGAVAELSAESGAQLELARGGHGRSFWAVSSVVDVRREPEHSSELLTQAIMGEAMTPLDMRGDWHLVMLDDGYHGWVRSWYIGESTQEAVGRYHEDARAMVGASVAYVLSEPRPESLPVSDITAGSRVLTSGSSGGYTAVELPGGRRGFIETVALEPAPAGSPSREAVIGRALRFKGIPYVWGGTSAKGFDCSGLVKRVLRMEGLETARDADQQSATGVPSRATGIESIPEADLMFFGEGGRITHVAISMGSGRFIHSYGDVRINSLLEKDPLYEEKLAGIFLFSRDLLSDTAP